MKALRQLVQEMLKNGIVQGVLAPVKGLTTGNVSPCFVTTVKEADGIAVDSYYSFSLANLRAKQVDRSTKVAMVGTTCDVRSLMELAKREQVNLDNVLAIAGAARDHPIVLALGLLLSIVLMGAAADLIARLLDKHRWIAYGGLAIVLYVACEMIYRGASELKLDQLARVMLQ